MNRGTRTAMYQFVQLCLLSNLTFSLVKNRYSHITKYNEISNVSVCQ